MTEKKIQNVNGEKTSIVVIFIIMIAALIEHAYDSNIEENIGNTGKWILYFLQYLYNFGFFICIIIASVSSMLILFLF
jgi:hypothetical protein